MADKISEILNQAVDTLFPIVSTYRCNKKIKRKIELLQEAESPPYPKYCIDSFPSVYHLSDAAILRNEYENAIAQKASLEDKAKTLVATSTISTTLLVSFHGTATTLFEQISPMWARTIFAFLVIYAVGYMVAAGVSAIKIFTADIRVYLCTTPSESTSNDETNDDYRKCIMSNSFANLVRSNNLSLSFSCLKRSFIILFLIFSVLIIVA